jgi:hypothetical protein
MNIVTMQTRQMSFEDIQDKKKKRYEQILNRLSDREMTAKEIAVEMFELGMIPSSERNYTAPRLNELEKMHYVKVIDKKKCEWTGKLVSIYRKTTKLEKMELDNINHIPYID